VRGSRLTETPIKVALGRQVSGQSPSPGVLAMSDERLANILFGAEVPPTAGDQQVAAHVAAIGNGLIAATPAVRLATSEERLAKALFGGSPEPAAAEPPQPHAAAPADTERAAVDVRTVNAADVLFGDSATLYEPTFALHRSTLQEIGFTPEEVSEGEGLIIRTAQEHKFNVADASHLFNAWAEARVQAERGSISSEQLERRAQQWEEDAYEALRSRYGVQTDDLIERTARFVDGVPALRDALSLGHLGSRPDIVERLVAHVDRHNIR
jgi:hypothetical protein